MPDNSLSKTRRIINYVVNDVEVYFKLYLLLYADDTVILAESQEQKKNTVLCPKYLAHKIYYAIFMSINCSNLFYLFTCMFNSHILG